MEPLLTLNQLATRLGLPSKWLRVEATAGRIPCLRVGRKLRFNQRAVEGALSQRASESNGTASAI